MKKINLLSRAEMKQISGGSMNPDSCTAKCPGRKDVTCIGTPCAAEDGNGCIAWNDGTPESSSCSNSPIEEP